MSDPKAADIAYPTLDLRHCSTDDHCRSLIEARAPFWWFQSPGRSDSGFSKPFRDETCWWYASRRGFCWPVEALTPMKPTRRHLPYTRTFIGYQHCLDHGDAANSTLVINVILGLRAFGPASLSRNRRRMVRTGAKSCEVTMLDSLDDESVDGAARCWNDLVKRTGWKHARTNNQVGDSWRRLLDLPGATVLIARQRQSGRLAGFLITKIYGDTAYVDTIASDSALLACHPNDILMYTFIRNAQRIAGVSKAHYSIKSNVEGLERFKRGMGFTDHPFPAYLHLRSGMSLALRLAAPKAYRRIRGQFDTP